MTEWAMPRRSLGAPAALLVALAAIVPAAARADPAATAPVVVIEGRGFGHGVGMAQDGALAMASAGASAAAILNRFYPGTVVAKRSASVRVGVYDAPGPVTVVLPAGGEVRDAPSGPQSTGFPIAVNPGGSVSLAFDGSKYKATALAGATVAKAPAATTTTASPSPVSATGAQAGTAAPPTTSFLDPLLQALLPTTLPPTTVAPTTPSAAPGGAPGAGAANVALTSRGLWAVPKGDGLVAVPGTGRSYRGTLVAGAGGQGMQLTDELDVELYLRGMGEMPASWPAAALQAQAIAARTFAVRAAAAGRTLCDDQQCQVYIGAGNESATNNAAVAATKGQVLTYQGGLAEAVYSASAGGISATPAEGFGPDSPELPYLKPVEYPVADPQLWATSLPLAELGSRFGYRGALRGVEVSRTGPSGRPLEITFDGDSGPMAVDAHRFFSVLQLRSTLFTLRVEGTPVAAVAAPLGAQAPDVPPVDPTRPQPLIARQLAPSSPLGRAPWVGAAALLLAMWATAAHRVTGAGRPVAAAVGGDAEGPVAEGPVDEEQVEEDSPH
jgi:SpoIID/LytB domain protein